MSVNDCVFCKMVAGQIPVTKIYEDAVVLSFLDIGPISDGHTLVIPKQHFEKLHQCPAEILGKLASRLGKIAKAVAAAMNSDGYNVLCNNGRAAGQLVQHLHFHIIPRNTGDAVFNRPGSAGPRLRREASTPWPDGWPAYKYEKGKIEEIADKIRENL